jgi:hypothetical protein
MNLFKHDKIEIDLEKILSKDLKSVLLQIYEKLDN